MTITRTVGQSAGVVLEVVQTLNSPSEDGRLIRRIQRRRVIRFRLQHPLFDRNSSTETGKWRMDDPETIRAELCSDMGGHAATIR
jgi:hypothetical protein